MYFLFSHYDFDLDRTLYFFIAGRYEFSNKGVDMFIEALARLNHFMKVRTFSCDILSFCIQLRIMMCVLKGYQHCF